MGSGVVVRAAAPEADAAAVAAVYAPYVRETAISFEEEAPDATEMARRIRRTTASLPWLVAEDEGAVVGYAYAAAHRERAAYRWAADVSVYVASTAQRRGVGRALYTALLRDLRGRGTRTVWAGTTLPNAPSVALHEAMGFRPVGVYRAVGWKHGAWHDVGWWGLDLADGRDDPPPPGPRGSGA